MPSILETDRLILRTWQDSDIESFCEMNVDPEVMAFFPSLCDRECTLKLIEKCKQQYKDYGYTYYAVELTSTSEFIGAVGLLHANFEAHFTPAVEIGWRLAHRFWGHGYATEAAKAVLDYAFTKLNIKALVSFTAAINHPSQRVMKKIGLKHDPADDFNHPSVDSKSPLYPHVLYRLSQSDYFPSK